MAVLAATVAAAGFGTYRLRVQQRQSAVRAEFEARGAIVQVEHSGRITQVVLCAVKDFAGSDLRRLEVFPHLQHLNLQDLPVTDDDLAVVSRHSELESLNLVDTSVTDAGLKHLYDLPALRTIDLRRTDVTSAGVRALKKAIPALDPRVDRLRVTGLVHLERAGGVGRIDDNFELTHLDLSRAKIADDDLELLRGQKSLQMLNLAGRPITDAGIQHLALLTNLEELWLSNTRISSAGLQHITALKKLRAISLTNTAVTDEGVAFLSELPNLQVLHLGGTGIGDAALEHVKKLPRLTKVWLNQTQISSEGLTSLRQALPHAAIVGQAEATASLPEIETQIAPG